MGMSLNERGLEHIRIAERIVKGEITKLDEIPDSEQYFLINEMPQEEHKSDPAVLRARQNGTWPSSDEREIVDQAGCF